MSSSFASIATGESDEAGHGPPEVQDDTTIADDHRRLVIKVYLWIRVLLVASSPVLLWLLSENIFSFRTLSHQQYPKLWESWFLFATWSILLWVVGFLALLHNKKTLLRQLDFLIWVSLFPDSLAIFIAADVSGGTASPFYRSVYLLIAIHAYHLVPPRLHLPWERPLLRLIFLGGVPSVGVALGLFISLHNGTLDSLELITEFGLQCLMALAFIFLAWTNLKHSSTLESKKVQLHRAEINLSTAREDLKTIQTRQNLLLDTLAGIHATADVNSSTVFYQRLRPVAKLVGEVLEAEYCALGLYHEGKIEDIAIWMANDRHEEPRIRFALEKVRLNDVKSSFVGTILTQHRKPLYWDSRRDGDLLNPNNVRRVGLGFPVNQEAAEIHRDLLKIGSLRHMLVLPLYSQRGFREASGDLQEPPRPIGYFQLINRLTSNGQVAPSGFPEEDDALTKTIKNQLSIAIENFNRRKQDRARQLEQDFFRSMSEKTDIHDIFLSVLQYLNCDLNSRVASLWLPIEDDFSTGEDNYSLLLRAVAVSGSDPSKDAILEEKLRRNFHVKPTEARIGGFLRENLSATKVLHVKDLSEGVDCWESHRAEIGTNQLLAVPILPYPQVPAQTELPLWKELLAILCLRPVSRHAELTPDIEEKLFRFARYIAIIIEQSRLRLRNEQINRLRVKLDDLSFSDLNGFYASLVELTSSVMDARSCSLFLQDKGRKELLLAATTSLNFQKISLDGSLEILPAENYLGNPIYSESATGITAEAFRRGTTILVPDTHRQPGGDLSFVEEIDSQRPRSLLVAPILSADKKSKKCSGVLRCVNPNRPPGALPAFLQMDKEFLTLLTGILSRLIENAQWNEERKEFLRELAHEMITPLSVAEQNVGFVEKVIRGERHAKDREEPIRYIRENLDFVNRLILDIQLQFGNLGRRENYDFSKKADLRPMIEKMKKLLLERARSLCGVDIRTMTRELPELHVDPMRLEQVIFNLLYNAIKYSTRRAGDIIIKYDLLYSKVEGRRHWGWHTLSVQNWGLGVREGEEDLIFEEYVRGSNIESAPSGTGMGLAVSRRIADNHEGVLRLTRRHKPTIFTLFLPTYLETRTPEK